MKIKLEPKLELLNATLKMAQSDKLPDPDLLHKRMNKLAAMLIGRNLSEDETKALSQRFY